MQVRAETLAYSSVVGGGIMLMNEAGSVVGQLLLRGFIPNPGGPMPYGDPYKTAYVAMCERIAAAINAGQPERQIQHYKNSNVVYDVIDGEALFQVSTPDLHLTSDVSRPERRVRDGDPVTVYRNPDGMTFVRFPDEMTTSRFKDV